jgi:hypothetical protein
MPLISAVGVFCEDIREEAANKHSLVGILPDNINAPALPSVLPKLGVYVRVIADVSWKPAPIALHLRPPDGTTHQLGAFPMEGIAEELARAKAGKSPFVTFVFQAVAAPFPLLSEGRIFLVVTVGKREFRCGMLNVQLVASPSSTVSQPPA